MERPSFMQAEGLAIGYDGKALVQRIALSADRGEILVLIGPNGAGKSTLLKTMIRQLTALEGTILLDGRDIAGYRRAELAKTLSAVQTIRVSTELQTVWDVVSAGRYPHTGLFGRLSGTDREKINEAMALTDVSELAECDYSRISDGQRQRVLLARALCQEPRLLVLDEPTSFLDIHYKLEFLSLLQRLVRKEKLAVVISMHELDLAFRIADRVLCIRPDGTADCLSPEAAFTDERIASLFHLAQGQYHALTGCAELSRPEGAAKVFVIGGAGYGIPVYRQLQREGIPFAAGILWENDVEYPTARALAERVVAVPAFSRITEEKLSQARRLIRSAERVICALPREKMTGFAEALRELETE